MGRAVSCPRRPARPVPAHSRPDLPGARSPVPEHDRGGRRRRRGATPGRHPDRGKARGGGAMKIAMVSEHASPLAALGGVDAGGQNVHVAALADALARRGHQVTVYTRREDPTVAERVRARPGVEVVHVPAGPPSVLPKDELLPFMTAFGDWMRQTGRARPARRRPRPLLDVRSGGGASPPHLSRPAGPDLPRARFGQTAPPGRRGHQPREPGRPRADTCAAQSTWSRHLSRRGR